jgi:hypothetical protein
VDTSGSINQVAKSPEFCYSLRKEFSSSDNDNPLFLGLSKAGKLYVANKSGSTTLATNANSFCCASEFVIYVTTAHEAHFVPIQELSRVLSPDHLGDRRVEGEVRRVERGSRIITAVSSNMALVLQMPRGNLETVNPRPRVLEVVKKEMDRLVPNSIYLELVTEKYEEGSGAKRFYHAENIALIWMFLWTITPKAFSPTFPNSWSKSRMWTTSTFSSRE